MADTAAMSTSRMLGLAGDSKNTTRVAGPMAASRLAGLVRSMCVTLTPNLASPWLRKPNVQP
jgi:hypothetical protein